MKNKQKRLKSKEKKTDAITNQNKRLEAVTNNERLEVLTNKNIYKGIFDKTIKQKFDEKRELIEEKNHSCLTYYFKGDTAKKGFDNFNNCIELFKKIQSGKIKLKEAKKE